MFKPVGATSVEEYINALEPGRREVIEYLHEFIQKCAPRLKPHFAYNMLGYGSYKYLNYKKQEVDWPIVALASQKRHFSIYVCATVDGQYLAEKYGKELGRVSIGKSCIRFKRLDDLDTKALARLLKEAARETSRISPKPDPKRKSAAGPRAGKNKGRRKSAR